MKNEEELKESLEEMKIGDFPIGSEINELEDDIYDVGVKLLKWCLS